MNSCIFHNGIIIKNNFNDYPYLWCGLYSVAHKNGSIVKFVVDYLQKIKQDSFFLLTGCDGNITKAQVNEALKDFSHVSKYTMVATLAQHFKEEINYLYLPLDDSFFDNGVSFHFQHIFSPSWKERKPMAFWRGSCSGGGMESIRCRTVNELMDYEHADVKLTKNGWEDGKNIPNHFFKEKVELNHFFQYKIFMIIDGNTIASNHMWGFATGCVPFILSNATLWFTDFLIPFVNYIPIKSDLSNLKEMIEWVRKNDGEAEEIAKNALLFSKTIFSPEFQRKSITDQIDKIYCYTSFKKLLGKEE